MTIYLSVVNSNYVGEEKLHHIGQEKFIIQLVLPNVTVL